MNRSEAFFEEASRVIPGGVNSPVRAFNGVGGDPLFFERAEGACLYDVDGRSYIDYVGSWGPMIAGHANPEIIAAVQQAAKGPMQRVVEYSEAPLVSSDIIGNTDSSIFDALSTSSQKDGYARIVSWYDNEWGYSNRVVDLIGMLAKLS